MAQPKGSLGAQLIVVVVQTLIFGALLAILGYWLDYRLEIQKQELAIQSERTKALISSLEPQIQQRRAAYLEFQSAARDAKNVLEVYYYSASPPEQTARRAELERIANELGVGPGGATSSWMTHSDAVEVVKGLIDLREKYQDVSSPQMNSAVDEFIDSLMRDLREGAKDSNNNDEFNDSAKGRLREAFDKLNNHIGDALGLDQLPVR